MHLLGLIVFACFTLSLQSPAPLFEDVNDEESRVYLGRYATAKEFPWMVHLQISKGNGKASVCGGFIISKNHVMTAAHCVCTNATLKKYVDVAAITGRIGHIERAQATPVTFNKLIVHQDYNEDYNNDIALLHFKAPIQYNNDIQKICISDTGKTFPNKQAVVQMGWGRFDNSSAGTSPTLKTTSVGYLLDNSSCIQEMSSYTEPGQICVSNANREKICGGDSGGPLCVIKGTDKLAIGVVSYDFYTWCAEGNDFPVMYTDISYYAKWVKTSIKDTEICWKK